MKSKEGQIFFFCVWIFVGNTNASWQFLFEDGLKNRGDRPF